MSELPSISIVMPTYQRRDALRRTLGRLALIEYPHDRLELVLVCDGCTDGSADVARSIRLPFPIHVLEQANQGPAAARNAGVAKASGPFVLFLDDDVLASPGLVAEHVRAHLEAPHEDRAVIGTLLPPAELRSPWVQWELDTVVNQYSAMQRGMYHPTPRQFYTGNASLRLTHIIAAGGFDTGFRRAEDVELGFRLQRHGLKFVFRPAASAVHLADRSLASWLQAGYVYGRTDIVLGLHRGRPDMLRAMVREFRGRNPIIRGLVRCALHVPCLDRAVIPPAAVVARFLTWLGWRRISHGICSLLFNLAYWRGVSDELGGLRLARDFIASGRISV